MPRRLQISLGELLDRFTIEKRKEFYGQGNPKLINDVRYEICGRLATLTGCNEGTVMALWSVVSSAALLGIHNADIANLEWQVRAGQQLSDAEQGKRARVIRHINDLGRVRVKQEISAQLSELTETRQYGYGEELKAEEMKLDVQEPVNYDGTVLEKWPHEAGPDKPICGKVAPLGIPLICTKTPGHEGPCGAGASSWSVGQNSTHASIRMCDAIRMPEGDRCIHESGHRCDHEFKESLAKQANG